MSKINLDRNVASINSELMPSGSKLKAEGAGFCIGESLDKERNE